MNGKLGLSLQLPSAPQSPLIFPHKADGQGRSFSSTSSLSTKLPHFSLLPDTLPQNSLPTSPQNWKTDADGSIASSASDWSIKLETTAPQNWRKSTENSEERALDIPTSESARRSFPQNWKNDGRGKSAGSRRTQFKARSENGGLLDPRINVGGRPKIIREETSKWLEERDETGKTNARKAVEGVGAVAQAGTKSSAQAFKTLHDLLEDPSERNKADTFDIGSLNPNILAAMKRLALRGHGD